MKFIIGLILLIVFSCTPESDQVAGGRAEFPFHRKVRTVTVKSKRIASAFPVSGTVSSAQITGVHATCSGFVRQVYRKNGDRVKTGDTLVIFDSADAALNRMLAEVRVKKLQIEYESERLGYLDNSSGNADHTLYYLTGLAEAELMLDQARLQEKRTVVCSATDGVLYDWAVEAGEYFTRGAPLGKVVSAYNRQATAYFLEGEQQWLTNGMAGWVRVPLSGTSYRSSLLGWSPVFDEKGRLETYWTLPDSAEVMPGQGVVIYPEFRRRAGIVLPVDALAGDTGKPVVFTVENDTARYTVVETRWYDQDSVEVVSGLSDGQRVILSGQISLHEGTPVEEIF